MEFKPIGSQSADSTDAKARRGSTRRAAPPLVLVVALLALLLASCEGADHSDATSPSGRALLGTTEGTATYESNSRPPEASEAEAGWEFQLGNVRYATLENDDPSLQVVTRTTSQEGAAMEVWIWSEDHTPLHWEAGTTGQYDGVFCFQYRLTDEGEALQLERREQYWMTIAFRDEETGEYAVVAQERIAGVVPELDGDVPGAESRVGSVLLGCPRSVI